MTTSQPGLTSRQRELVDAYRARDLSVTTLLTEHDATRQERYRALARAREPFRRPASARPGRNLLRRAPIDPPLVAESRGGDMERRLERLLSDQIASIEKLSARKRGADPEKIARALALSVKTLHELRRAGAGRNEHDIDASEPAEPRRSLTELRDELYGHLLRIRDEERVRLGDACARAERDRGEGHAAPLGDLLPREPAPAG